MDDLVSWSVVVPVKRPEFAKTRLADAAGSFRPALARAFAADTIAAALRCSAVAQVIVVTDDAEAAEEARTAGADVVADVPDAGLNAALRHGAEAARLDDAAGVGAATGSGEDAESGDAASVRDAGVPVAAISADLPALRPDELAAVLHEAARHPSSFVADTAGIGTTLYAAGPGVLFDPRFGGRSRAAHRAAGAAELDLSGISSVRRDVDTGVDLWDAVRLGVGPRTAEVVAHLNGFGHTSCCRELSGRPTCQVDPAADLGKHGTPT